MSRQPEPYQFVVQVHGAQDEAQATAWLHLRLSGSLAQGYNPPSQLRAVVIGTSLSRAEEQ